jgi:hypothetical protein
MWFCGSHLDSSCAGMPMLSQLCLRPFDLGVAVRLMLVPRDRYEPMARSLGTSTSAVHRSVARLTRAGLCHATVRTVDAEAFLEFARCGARYAFPPMRGSVTSGMPTAALHPDLVHLAGGGDYMLVWPIPGGSALGTALVPLFRGLLDVARRDVAMYRLLAALDLLRVCESRDADAVAELVRGWVAHHAMVAA